MSAGEDALDSELLLRSLNYHGQQLTGFIAESTLGRAAGAGQNVLRNVNYHLYQSRSKELRMEDRGKRMLVHRFISQNADFLFAQNHTKSQDVKKPTEAEVATEGPLAETSVPLPPLEAFLPSMSEEDRAVHFYDLIEIGDSLCCRVIAKNMSGLMLQVLCFGGATAKTRHLEDLKLRCICPASDVVEDARPFEIGDLTSVAVSDVRREAQRMLVTMKTDSLPEAVRSKTKLGLIQNSSQLPLIYRCTKDALEKGVSYDVILERSAGFLNPSNVSVLAEELGLTSKVASASMTLRQGFAPEECALSLRKKQNAKCALGHVAAGIKYFKAGNTIEAFQSLNQALRIDPENVEGLVARGALYANNTSLDKAVSDFNEALKLDPTHRNANKYLSETLCAIARNLEGETKFVEAGEMYEKILTRFPDCHDAKESLQFLKKFKGSSEGPSLAIRSDLFDPSSNMMAARNNDNVFEVNDSRKEGGGGLSPFSQKMRESSEALKMSAFSAANPPPENVLQDQVPLQPAQPAVMVSYPLPPPGYGMPQFPSVAMTQHGYRNDAEYDRAVNAFLRQTSATAASSSSSGRRKRSRSRSRSPPAAYRARDPTDLRNRIRAKSRSRERRRSMSRERRTSDGRNRSKERSSRRTREDSKERESERKSRRSREGEQKTSRERSKDRGGAAKDDARRSRESAGKTEKGKAAASSGGSELSVDVFAERLNNYFKSKEAAAVASTSKDEEAALKKLKKISAEELEIVVKDLPKRSEDLRSPRVRAAFTASDEEGVPAVEMPAPVDPSKKKGIVVKLWRPVGSRKEEETGRDPNGEASKTVSGQRRSRFDQDKPLEFVIRVDPVTGLYQRVPKDPLDSTAPSEPSSSKEDSAKERRSVRKRSASPEDRRRRRTRSRSPARKTSPASEERRRRRSRTRSPGSRRRSGRSRSRSPRTRRDSGENYRKDSHYRRPSPPSSKAGSSSASKRNDIEGVRAETLNIVKEREKLDREKKELLAIQRIYDYSLGSDIGLPRPVPSSSSPPGGGSSAWGAPTASRFDNRDVGGDLRDVLRSSSGSGSSSSRPIIPNAPTFEALEDYLEKTRREKREELRERNKDFIKPKAW